MIPGTVVVDRHQNYDVNLKGYLKKIDNSSFKASFFLSWLFACINMLGSGPWVWSGLMRNDLLLAEMSFIFKLKEMMRVKRTTAEVRWTFTVCMSYAVYRSNFFEVCVV